MLCQRYTQTSTALPGLSPAMASESSNFTLKWRWGRGGGVPMHLAPKWLTVLLAKGVLTGDALRPSGAVKTSLSSTGERGGGSN